MTKTLIQGDYVVGFDGKAHEIIRDGVVVFSNQQIVFVGENYFDPVDKRIDAKGCLISPGFIDTHIHAGSNAGDYLYTETDKPDFFGSNYLAHVAPLAGKSIPHHLEDIEVCCRFSLIHTLKSGATTVIDVGGAEKGAEQYVNLIDELGVRCFSGLRLRDADFCYDLGGRLQYVWNEDKGRNRLKRAIDFASKYNGACHGRLGAMLFPGQADTCTPALLKETKRAAKDLGLQTQIHAAMNLIEFHALMQKHRSTPIEFLHNVGFLGPEVSLSHCVFLSGHSMTAYPYGDDLKILADTGTSVSHCPLKYITLGLAMESFDRYIQSGVNVALGTDTYPKDMISEMRYAALVSRLQERKFTAGHPRDVYNAATLGGAKLLGRPDLGRLEKNAKADIAVIQLKNIAIGAVHDPIKTLVECASNRDVQMVIVDGEVIVDKGVYLRTDEDELIYRLQDRAEKVWDAVPDWHWTGKSIDQIVPPAFKFRSRH